MPDYFVVEFTDWVHIVATTRSGDMILVDQYRHAQQARFLEVPGGASHPSESADFAAVAVRELREETGFVPERVTKIGVQFPNPALQSNKLHIFLAEGCEKKHAVQLDPFEDLTAVLMPINKVYDLVESGGISHSLTVAALALCRPRLVVSSAPGTPPPG
jgi:8-oxo-dGTP pyrophosphatase MutT (NUDIX family)